MDEKYELLWEHAGEIADRDQRSMTRSVWTCAACSALVDGAVLRRHERWHLALDPLLAKKDPA